MSARGYENGIGAPHHVALEERRSLTVSGVEDVERFDENAIVLSTSQGTMVVSGSQLHIEKLSISYEEDQRAGRGGFFSRLLR